MRMMMCGDENRTKKSLTQLLSPTTKPTYLENSRQLKFLLLTETTMLMHLGLALAHLGHVLVELGRMPLAENFRLRAPQTCEEWTDVRRKN